MVDTISTKSSKETQQFAKQFASRLKNGDIVLLYGNLGAGKTTFVQGLAKGLGIAHRIISPTFIVLRTYEINRSSTSSGKKDSGQARMTVRNSSLSEQSESKGSSVKNFYHVDLYRLETEKEIEDIGLTDLMGKSDDIVVIEWPEKLGSLLPKNAWKISFETKGENKRLITVEKN